ncbi:MAG: glycosyltransferase [Anaerolineae bacterium]|nr:glycosyltransferase [Anaerolineae bacterium]
MLRHPSGETTIRRVCMVGAFDPSYARHAIIREGLEAHGVEVDLRPIHKHASARQRAAHLWKHFPKPGEVDAVILPAFNQLVAPVAWFLARSRNLCLLVDYMVGQLDTLQDRSARLNPAKYWLYEEIERFNLRNLHSVTDTALHREVFAQLSGVTPEHMTVLPVGVQSLDLLPPPPDNTPPVVQYAGTYIPFHGVDVILRAASRLPDWTFEMIGVGQTLPQARKIAQILNLQNVQFIEQYVPQETLRQWQTRSTLMLGVFGDAAKTDYVIPNKVFEALALGRPIITAQSQAIAEQFTDGEHLVLVPPGDDAQLAASIRDLLANPQQQAAIRQSGHQRIEEAFLPQHIGELLIAQLEAICSY